MCSANDRTNVVTPREVRSALEALKTPHGTKLAHVSFLKARAQALDTHCTHAQCICPRRFVSSRVCMQMCGLDRGTQVRSDHASADNAASMTESTAMGDHHGGHTRPLDPCVTEEVLRWTAEGCGRCGCGTHWRGRPVTEATVCADRLSHVMICALLNNPSRALRARRAACIATAFVCAFFGHPRSNNLHSTPKMCRMLHSMPWQRLTSAMLCPGTTH